MWEIFNIPNILRLRAEMDSLRKVYEEQTEKAKNEYMMIHSKKVIKHEWIKDKEMESMFFLYSVDRATGAAQQGEKWWTGKQEWAGGLEV